MLVNQHSAPSHPLLQWEAQALQPRRPKPCPQPSIPLLAPSRAPNPLPTARANPLLPPPLSACPCRTTDLYVDNEQSIPINASVLTQSLPAKLRAALKDDRLAFYNVQYQAAGLLPGGGLAGASTPGERGSGPLVSVRKAPLLVKHGPGSGGAVGGAAAGLRLAQDAGSQGSGSQLQQPLLHGYHSHK